MKGEHKPGYRPPRTGEKRAVRQPLKIDKLEQPVRDAILKARADGRTWEETAEAASKLNGEKLAPSVVHRWYDLRVAQVQREVLQQAERSRVIAGAFAAKGFEGLPEAAVNALSSEVFAIMEAGTPAEREKGLNGLVFTLSKLMTARAAEKRVELEREKIELAKKKFEELRAKADKATNDAAGKIGKGRALTIDDINRIRERALGLPPIQQREAASSSAA
jgi:hypothetical protein